MKTTPSTPAALPCSRSSRVNVNGRRRVASQQASGAVIPDTMTAAITDAACPPAIPAPVPVSPVMAKV